MARHVRGDSRSLEGVLLGNWGSLPVPRERAVSDPERASPAMARTRTPSMMHCADAEDSDGGRRPSIRSPDVRAAESRRPPPPRPRLDISPDSSPEGASTVPQLAALGAAGARPGGRPESSADLVPFRELRGNARLYVPPLTAALTLAMFARAATRHRAAHGIEESDVVTSTVAVAAAPSPRASQRHTPRASGASAPAVAAAAITTTKGPPSDKRVPVAQALPKPGGAAPARSAGRRARVGDGGAAAGRRRSSRLPGGLTCRSRAAYIISGAFSRRSATASDADDIVSL